MRFALRPMARRTWAGWFQGTGFRMAVGHGRVVVAVDDVVAAAGLNAGRRTPTEEGQGPQSGDHEIAASEHAECGTKEITDLSTFHTNIRISTKHQQTNAGLGLSQMNFFFFCAVQ